MKTSDQGRSVTNRRDIDTKPYVQHHPLFGYAYRPGAEMALPTPDGRTYTPRVNHQGIRSDQSFAHDVPRNRVRMLVAGDSVAAGQFVDNADRFSERLAGRHDNFEVLNTSLEGSGTDQQYLITREIAQCFDFDLLLLCPYIENIRRNLMDYRVAHEARTHRRVLTPKPRFELRDGRLHLRNVPVPNERPVLDDDPTPPRADVWTTTKRIKSLASRALDALRLKHWLYNAVRYEPFPEYRHAECYAWRLMAALVDAFADIAAPRPLIIAPQVYYAYLEHRLADNYLRRFRSLEQRGAIHVIDILPYFRRLSRTDRRACYWPDNCHYTPLGHRVAAEAIDTELTALGIFPPKTKRLRLVPAPAEQAEVVTA
jgi:hypothetical protein